MDNAIYVTITKLQIHTISLNACEDLAEVIRNCFRMALVNNARLTQSLIERTMILLPVLFAIGRTAGRNGPNYWKTERAKNVEKIKWFLRT